MIVERLDQLSAALPPWIANAGLAAASLGAGLVALAVCLGLAFIVLNALRKRQAVELPVKITSQCNLETVFQFKIDLGELEKRVKVAWLWNEGALPVKTIQQVRYVEEALPETALPRPGEETASPAGSPDGKALQKQGAAARKQYQAASGLANILANIGASLAAILPAPLNAPFKRLETAIRQGQKGVSDATAAPRRMQASVHSLESNVKRLGGKPGQTQATASTGAPVGEAQAAVAEMPARRAVTYAYQVTETFPLAPAESQSYRLVFRPQNPFRAWSGPFEVTSQPVELKDLPSPALLKTAQLAGEVDIEAIPWLWKGGLAILGLAWLALNAWWSAALVQWLLHFWRTV
ncbi:MAG: hypothetical protein VB089_03960 [Anaerolineaceae bacterium]|nr:hypothetical protein [Anaerolineaceae bacterium]